MLYCTTPSAPSLPLSCNNPTPDANYWSRVTRGMDFDDADLVNGVAFNRVLWKGMMGNRPFPSRPTGKDLRQNREKILAEYRRNLQHQGTKTPKPAGD